jgi:hypothetical protein
MQNISTTTGTKRTRKELFFTNLDVTNAAHGPIAVFTTVRHTTIDKMSPPQIYECLSEILPPGFEAPAGTDASIAPNNTILLRWPTNDKGRACLVTLLCYTDIDGTQPFYLNLNNTMDQPTICNPSWVYPLLLVGDILRPYCVATPTLRNAESKYLLNLLDLSPKLKSKVSIFTIKI